tara:strand:- start:369 stop:797 length:429 start_codon:yes stop_codon:yes gene_type:complete
MEYKSELSFLTEIGCQELPHSGRTLYDHLHGTAQILIDHDRPDYEVKAGLFHSIYGTEIYDKSKKIGIPRQAVRDLIGEHAELLAFIFCETDDRARKIIQGEDFEEKYIEALRWIEYANVLEQNKHSTLLVPLRTRLGIYDG